MSSADSRKELLRLRGLFGGETDARASDWLDALIAQCRAEAESSLRARLVAEVEALGPNDCGEPASTNEPRTFASGTGVGMAMMKSAVLQVIKGSVP